MLLFVLTIAKASDDDDDDCADSSGHAGPDYDGWVDSVVIVAICVVDVAVGVPFRAVSVVVAAFVRTVLVIAVRVVPHLEIFDIINFIS